MGLFDFIDMADNYEDRKVARFEEINNDLIIDTAWVNDCKPPYETAIQHKNYNNGQWVIVEHYETKEKALSGHMKWVKIMTTEPLPDKLDWR